LIDVQWGHIVTARPYLERLQDSVISTVEAPEEVYSPPPTIRAQLHALKTIPELSRMKVADVLVVVYREIDRADGFIITAFPISQEKRVRYQAWLRVYP
jgi:hypothetical protein